jgi:hypothetical protein
VASFSTPSATHVAKAPRGGAFSWLRGGSPGWGRISRDNAFGNWGRFRPQLAPSPEASSWASTTTRTAASTSCAGRTTAAVGAGGSRARQKPSPLPRRSGPDFVAGRRQPESHPSATRSPKLRPGSRTARTGWHLPVRDERWHAVAVCLPPIRRKALYATRLHEPRSSRHGAAAARGGDRARRGQGCAPDRHGRVRERRARG